ncbi:MAG: NAD(P)H-binding protein, partial [Bryobacteraceae bacterium]
THGLSLSCVMCESRNDVKKLPDPAKPDSLADSRVLDPQACDVTMAAADAKAAYSAIVLGATGNVGGRIVQLLIKNPLCRKVVVVTRRKTDAFAHVKVSKVVVNMDRLAEEVAPHAQGIDVALAAFGVGKGSAKMPEAEVRKIEIAYPQAFCQAAKAGGARVCGVMTAAGAGPEAGMKYAKIIGEKEKLSNPSGSTSLECIVPVG